MRGRRGVSEVLGAVVLLAAVVAIFIPLLAYSYTLESSWLGSLTPRPRDRLAIVSVWADADADLVNVTLYNYGSTNVVVDALYVDARRATPVSGFNEPQPPGLFNVVASVSLSPGVHRLVVVTVEGVRVEATFRA